MDFSALQPEELIDCYEIAAVLESEELKKVALATIKSKVTKDTLKSLCEQADLSPNVELKGKLREIFFAFARENKDLLQRDAMKPARKAYKAFMSGL